LRSEVVVPDVKRLSVFVRADVGPLTGLQLQIP
jgi:hypothetical protein